MDTCKICSGTLEKIFDKIVLNKYPANYLRCSQCYFVQTSKPVWIEEAYSSAITSLDIGLISRNLYLREHIKPIIDSFFPESKVLLDYGGGYGMFVRLMRDLGYNFFRQDIYCENLFAEYFDIKDSESTKFDLLTTFEVFEHLLNPLEEIEKMFMLSENIIFTTVLSPANVEEFENWWYVSPLTGQHIAFYHKKTLEFLAKKFGKELYSNGINLHVFTEKKINPQIVNKIFGEKKLTIPDKIKRKILSLNKVESTERDSLLTADYKLIEEKLKNKLL
jgi:hypothetical protein